MRYYTDYTLNIIGLNSHTETREEIFEKFREEYKELAKYMDSGVFTESVGWYGHEIDMRNFSEKYPELIFKLSGKGKKHEDIWIKYFKNGKMQPCMGKIVFQDFDESKLK